MGGFNAEGKDIAGGISQRFHQKYGRWEVRFRMDRGAGYGPAVLLWPQTEKWPDHGEIDIMEVPNPKRTRGVHFLHNGPENTKKGMGVSRDFTKWHVVAVDWLPKSITFYVDGKQTWRVTDPKLIPRIAPMHLALQNDVGCGWIPCRNSATPERVVMHVDWVKVYSLPGVSTTEHPFIEPAPPLNRAFT
ncbi:glycoside hydrolase family 16 protein [Nonomuraea sp. NPDC050790]|uniref:glycoside hydrolase family 16 protein n=1 Tax=Nonomuraea sp. NPDC050790 TaxID=3364371 RepID=UPI00378A8BBB